MVKLKLMELQLMARKWLTQSLHCVPLTVMGSPVFVEHAHQLPPRTLKLQKLPMTAHHRVTPKRPILVAVLTRMRLMVLGVTGEQQ